MESTGQELLPHRTEEKQATSERGAEEVGFRLCFGLFMPRRAREAERGGTTTTPGWMARPRRPQPQPQVWLLCYWALASKGLQDFGMTDMPPGCPLLLQFKVSCENDGWPHDMRDGIISLPFSFLFGGDDRCRYVSFFPKLGPMSHNGVVKLLESNVRRR